MQRKRTFMTAPDMIETYEDEEVQQVKPVVQTPIYEPP
jgi:hypothetical protein